MIANGQGELEIVWLLSKRVSKRTSSPNTLKKTKNKQTEKKHIHVHIVKKKRSEAISRNVEMLQTFKKVNEIQLSTISPSINKSEYWLLFYFACYIVWCVHVCVCLCVCVIFVVQLHTTWNGFFFSC